ncbi:MAG TPA: twin-arginine translocase TatA/TatE family subunit [Polyangiaceae bacterium]|jgi:sec-independent protein translocase protein TatA|nr:MAG: Sec-independent protein translocase protein TatAy [Deltaproteobacteria bacterium ADurb.Bin207]HNS98667.1 twin-arginine translocase TatA/TatE family subunit [Polyangiaceae bacterium]HNZ23317.1 twin-arginine translocase TatA/TatE family subunit [Polyangiaceae bacterium]HOD21913.1 twin-arginine translocase TatA/TatE family subunit [Polyangiaceae bacterium]HOE49358.1 twin-arginine translocase TatA/TatE family subunit [Polyangiaceae bacterium]
MGNIGPGQLLLIALIVLLIFGAGRIAEIGKGLGAGIRNFKKGLHEDDEDEKKQLTEGSKDNDKNA